jgi:putative Holliday junction resolvase
MRLLALDVGERRIGLASGVAEISTALPAGFIRRSRLAQDLQAVLDAARQRQSEAIIVGVPYLPEGGESPQTKQVRGFIRALRKETALTVHEVDEAFTSVEAEALMRDAGLEPSKDRGGVDAAAAVLILRRFLDSQGSIEDGCGAQFTDMSAGSPPTAGS